MKLSNIRNVQKAADILAKMDKNIEKLEMALSKEPLPDCGGIAGVFEYGYGCHVGKNSDRSGFNIDLEGCYVANQVYKATLDVLIEQRENVIAYLESIGVDVEEKDNG